MDHQPITYQQILAQQYAENAYLEDDDDVIQEEFQVEENQGETIGYELENQSAYNEFAGNRNTEELIVKTRDFEDRGKSSVRYNKDILRRVFNIDTRFRSYITPGFGLTLSGDPLLTSAQNSTNTATSTATHFVFRTHDIVKNAISVKLSSFEMPNRFHNLSSVRGNTSFQVKRGDEPYVTITVDVDSNGSGYYNNVSIVSEVEQKLNQVFPSTFTCTRNLNGQMTIATSDASTYTFNFPSTVVTPQLYPTLPQALGFTETIYSLTPTKQPIVSEDAIDMNMDTYIYLRINDWATVTPQVENDTFFTVFAKILVNVDKGRLIIDSDVTNTTHKTYNFLQPTNVQQMEIQLLDRLGNEISMGQNINYSMTLEIEDVVSKSLYEKLREM